MSGCAVLTARSALKQTRWQCCIMHAMRQEVKHFRRYKQPYTTKQPLVVMSIWLKLTVYQVGYWCRINIYNFERTNSCTIQVRLCSNASHLSEYKQHNCTISYQVQKRHLIQQICQSPASCILQQTYNGLGYWS